MLRVQKPMRIVLMEGFKDDESKQYKPSTVGDFNGFRKVTTSEKTGFKCKELVVGI